LHPVDKPPNEIDHNREPAYCEAMKISSVSIKNYKCFFETDPVPLSPNVTLITGRNNCGKSSFLDSFRFSQELRAPHRSERFEPRALLPEQAEFKYVCSATGNEVIQEGIRNGDFWISFPSSVDTDTFMEKFRQSTIETSFSRNSANQIQKFHKPGHGLIEPADPNQNRCVRYKSTDDKTDAIANAAQNGLKDSICDLIFNNLQSNTFTFDAQRFHIGRSQFQSNLRLDSSAGNLPGALSYLVKDPDNYDLYKSLVRRIFPEIRDIAVVPSAASPNQAEINLYFSESRREDLAMPLDQVGTGISQVMAVLYVITTYKNAIIAIDEPSSFLHPDATRNLIQIIKDNRQHQYIISTHSSEVISHIDADRIIRLFNNQREHQIQFESADLSNFESIRLIFGRIGRLL
jgi:predicted ATPase